MSKCFLSLGLFLGITIENVNGQNMGPIQLDRPDQTECPFIVPTKYIQLENGFTLENVNSTSKTYSHPSTLWKYGVNETFELRLITEIISIKEGDKTTSGLSPITVGFKTNICSENGIIPTTSFIGHITTANIGSKEFQTSYIAPSFRFTMQHTLSDKISLAYNLGAEWDGETAAPTYVYTLTTGIALTSKFGGYLELYGFAQHETKAEHRFDCGLTYLLNNDLMIDLSGGLGLTNNAPKNYISLGLSFRFKAI